MTSFTWQRCLNVSENEATGYHDNARRDLIDSLSFVPDTALDIGCGTGSTGAYLKQKHPDTKVWGIELNKAAAEIAATRLDHVVSSKFEEANLEAVGLLKGTLDLVLCADVLEHLYNPWEVMTGLQEYLSERGRIVISIPNIRYLPLLDDLARGYWRYADFGILDITHLRFFTLKELKRFAHETGYVVESLQYGMDPTLLPTFERYRQQLPCTIDTGKLVLRDVNEDELNELFSGQFFITVKKGAMSLDDYAPPRMGCFFWRGQHTDYMQFLASHRTSAHETRLFEDHFSATPAAPRFELIIVCKPNTEDQLGGTIQSSAQQLYPNFQLTVLGDGGGPEQLRGNDLITWIDTQGQYWPALKNIGETSTSDWLLVLESGDQLADHALLYIAEVALRRPETVAIYVDEDCIDASGEPDTPYFKPDFCLDYFLEHPYLGDGVALRTAALRQAGGMRTSFGSPFQDAILRLLAHSTPKSIAHVPDVLYHRHPRRSLARQFGADDTGRRALETYFLSTNQVASVAPGVIPGSHRIAYALNNKPSVTWITDSPKSLSATRELLEKTYLQRRYGPLALIIFVATDADASVVSYLDAVDKENIEGLQVFVAGPNTSATQRFHAAIQQSASDYIFLLRPDSHPASEFWIEELLADGSRPDIGAVAPRVISTQGRLIGNAILLGCNGVASGMGHGDHFSALGHFGRQQVVQNPSALSTDALLFARQNYLRIGGFDTSLGETAAAIDFSLRLVQSGQRLLWTPHTTLVCTGDGLNTMNEHDEAEILQRWLPSIARDPAYNPNLSRAQAFALTARPEVSKLRLPWKPLPRVMAFPADVSGCGHYRVIEPFNAVLKAGLVDGYLGLEHYNPYDMSCFGADTLVLQRQVLDSQLEFLRAYRKFFNLKLVFELDDLITNLPPESFHRGGIPKDIAKRLRAGLQLCDRFIVSTEPLAEAYRHHIGDIRVVPNRIDIEKWGNLQPQRRTAKKPRVGWAGGVSHVGDLALISDVVKALSNEVDWVFLGLLPDNIRPYVAEHHDGVPTPQYPAKLASLNLDLAIAPIDHNDFNACKSNLKLLEYGILGFPVIASDFGPYQCSFPITLVKNRPRDWIKAIRDHIHDLDATALKGDMLRQHVINGWILQDHVEEWRSAWLDF